MNNTNQDTTDNLNTTIPEISTPERSPPERSPLTAPEVANYILRKFFEDNIEITPLKLQKIVYITYGWFLVIAKKRLFDEPILAWKLGPVIPSIYYFYKGKDRIKNKEYIFINEDYNQESTEINFPFPDFEVFPDKLYSHFSATANMVYRSYKNKSATELVSILHKAGSPWDKVYNRNNEIASGKNKPLLDEDIKQKSLETLKEKYPEIFYDYQQ